VQGAQKLLEEDLRIFDIEGNGWEQCGRYGCEYDQNKVDHYKASTLLNNPVSEEIFARKETEKCITIYSSKEYLFISSKPDAATEYSEITISEYTLDTGLQVYNNGKKVVDSTPSDGIFTLLGSEAFDSNGNEQWPDSGSYFKIAAK